jgi:predicted PhzF superfamily epimerase YddE/YHI9
MQVVRFGHQATRAGIYSEHVAQMCIPHWALQTLQSLLEAFCYTYKMENPYMFRVFVNEKGEFGDPVRLILDEAHEFDTAQRIAIATDFGNDEVVFVNNLTEADVSIYHSKGEVDFAGSVLLGAAWQISQIKGEPIQSIRCLRGNIESWQQNDIWWIRAMLENNLGNWEYEQLRDAQAVDAIQVVETDGWKKMVWAWVNEEKGLIRARTFASTINMPEVQGNGSGSMNLAGQLQRDIQITHGDGSVIYARPAFNNSAELGGRVISR